MVIYKTLYQKTIPEKQNSKGKIYYFRIKKWSKGIKW